MPADKEYALILGARGLNFRDQPAIVGFEGFVDSLNWRLDQEGAPTKRLGYDTYLDVIGGTTNLPATPLELTSFEPIGGTPALIAYCVDGNVYSSPGDGTWTSIVSGLDTGARPSFTVLNDKLYWVNGADPLQQYDGVSVTAIAAADNTQTITMSGGATRGGFQLLFNGFGNQTLDDVQTLSITGSPTGGHFTITLSAQTTGNIAYNATNLAVQGALRGISTIAGPYVQCTGGPLPDNPVTIEFIDKMGGQAQSLMTTTDSFSGGSTPASSIAHTLTGVGLNLASTHANVQSALEATFGIGTGNVTVTGGPLSTTPLVVEFKSALGNAPQPTLVADTDFDKGGLSIVQTQKGSSSPPLGAYICAWRNRLWIANSAADPERVWWSAVGDPTSWPTNNFVDLLGPKSEEITAITPAPNIGIGFDGADGVLVYKAHSLHRIIDDSDNVFGVTTGGANVLVDSATGCINSRTVATINGIVYSVGADGIYATTGHGTLVLQSAKLARFFETGISPAGRDALVAIGWRSSYLLAMTPEGEDENSLVLELHTALPPDPGDGQRPIMAHTIPAHAWAIIHNPSLGSTLYFTDASDGNELFVRKYASGGADTSGVANANPIQATARTGSGNLGIPHPKKARRIQLSGRGTILVGVTSDFETGVGETQPFTLSQTNAAKWGDGTQWGTGTWGSSNGVSDDTRWYTKRGRYFGLTLNETSADVSAAPDALAIAGFPVGNASIYSAVLAVTPLATDF